MLLMFFTKKFYLVNAILRIGSIVGGPNQENMAEAAIIVVFEQIGSISG